MTTLTWTGQGKTDANPNDPNNWWPAKAPTANDDVVFPWGTEQLDPNIKWVAHNITIAGGSSVTFSSVPTITGNLYVTGGGKLYVTAVAGKLIVTTLTVDNGASIISARAIDAISIDLQGGGSFVAQNGIDVATTVTVGNGSRGDVWGPVVIDGVSGGNNAHVDLGSSFTCHGGGTACYAPGTMILTDEGEVAIENIVAGSKTHEGHEILWVGRGNNLVDWVDFNKNGRKLTVTSDHLMVHEDLLYPAKSLISLDGVEHSDHTGQEYFHLQCAQHVSIIANGYESESFFDVDGRNDLETVSGTRLNKRFDRRQSFLPIIA